MANQIVTRSFNTSVGETSNVRDVSEKMLLLEEDRTPLYVLTNKSNRKVNASSPRLEWFEDQDLGMIGTVSNGTTDLSSVATTITVSDGTFFGASDVVQVSAAASSSTLEEHILVSSVSGNVLTITRAFGGTTAGTIGATNVLKILGVATTENGSIDAPRTTAKSPKTSGCQIFEWPIAITRTGAATKEYGAPQGDRALQQMKGMRRQKIEIENAGLFGGFSETLASPGSRYSSMGVRSIISTNVTSGGNTLTYTTFLGWARSAFRFGATEKLLVAAPVVKEALDYFAANKQQTRAEDKVFGVSLQRFVTSNGVFQLGQQLQHGRRQLPTRHLPLTCRASSSRYSTRTV
jgi:hypothetical protein